MAKTTQVTVRVHEEDRAAVERIQRRLAEQRAGVVQSQSNVVLEILRRGLQAMGEL